MATEELAETAGMAGHEACETLAQKHAPGAHHVMQGDDDTVVILMGRCMLVGSYERCLVNKSISTSLRPSPTPPQ
jgi:hypothetical protein